MHPFPRRALISLTLPLLQGCTAPFPRLPEAPDSREAAALLNASAAAHGMEAYGKLTDISVSYAGQWHALVDTMQPDLVDAGFRGQSEERLLPRRRLAAQAYAGPAGSKHVVRLDAPQSGGEVHVWVNGEETRDRNRRDAAALVADAYALFLCGPMLLARAWNADKSMTMRLARPERITVDGWGHDCDILRFGLTPGMGLSESDEIALFIDRQEHLMRRVRFTLNGLESTQDAVAEVDIWRHVTMGGIRWPTAFHEGLLRPVPLPVHDWHMVGLDLDRGFSASDIGGAEFAGSASAPAARLP